ncbi:hypothetical protein P7K49_002102 [Saguinus oedipus]|uniref:Uncharacterized protein n=1 Tax=Saguinus oedipus TaxID=9490 RepID=A0ABQ9WGF0_SAGOE|nr:hypothetical protein P7K49_002102 [Saguinus oedipus]
MGSGLLKGAVTCPLGFLTTPAVESVAGSQGLHARLPQGCAIRAIHARAPPHAAGAPPGRPLPEASPSHNPGETVWDLHEVVRSFTQVVWDLGEVLRDIWVRPRGTGRGQAYSVPWSDRRFRTCQVHPENPPLSPQRKAPQVVPGLCQLSQDTLVSPKLWHCRPLLQAPLLMGSSQDCGHLPGSRFPSVRCPSALQQCSAWAE